MPSFLMIFFWGSALISCSAEQSTLVSVDPSALQISLLFNCSRKSVFLGSAPQHSLALWPCRASRAQSSLVSWGRANRANAQRGKVVQSRVHWFPPRAVQNPLTGILGLPRAPTAMPNPQIYTLSHSLNVLALLCLCTMYMQTHFFVQQSSAVF